MSRMIDQHIEGLRERLFRMGGRAEAILEKALRAVYEVPAVARNEMVRFFKPAVDKAVERPWIAQGNALFEPIRLQMANVLSGKTSPEEAAESTGDAYRKLLKDYK